MAFVIADRVRETSTTIGTGNFTLAGAVTGYQTFDAALDTGDTTYYTIADQSGVNWEVGIGTFTSPSTLARTTILSSSNGGSVVTFGAGTKDVFISLPASRTNVEDQPNLIEVNSSSAALRITQTGAGNALVVEDSANPDSSPFVVDASGNVGVGTGTPTAKLDIGSGNLAFTSTAQRITGDFSNGTQSNRVFFQTTTAGGGTSVGTIPNATGANSAFNAFGGPDPGNASFAQLRAGSDTSDVRLTSGINGTGTYYPMTFYTGGSERMRLDTSGNVGIGTSSPDALLTVNTGASFGAGAVGAPSISAKGDLDTGMWFPAANTAAFSTGGSERLRIDTSGNVGIGTSSPSSYGKFAVIGTSGTQQAFIGVGSDGWTFNTFSSGSAYLTYGSATVTTTAIGNQQAIPLVFLTTNTERMRIDSSGNVGIGTSSVTYQLTVQGTGQDTANLTDAGNKGGSLFLRATGVTSGSGGALLFGTTFGNQTPFAALKGLVADGTSNTIGDLAFSTRNAFGDTSLTERMRINSSGNVGIGTSSPAFNAGSGLEVQRADVATVRIEDTLHSTVMELKAANGATAVTAVGSYPLLFETNGTERARINSSGVLLVGTTAELSGHTFQNSGGATTYRPTTNTGFGVHHFYSDVSGTSTLKAYVQADGTYTNASDEKLKTNIVKARSYLNDLMRIEIVNYTWKGGEDNEKKLGVIAQQVESVFPSLVKEVIGSPATGETQKMLPQEVFIPMLITAIQELKADFDAYKAAHP